MKSQIKALKVKIKSLAAEAVIIRTEEGRVLANKRRPDPALYVSLRKHRVTDVRRESRAALLAYGFLRRRSYAACERSSRNNHPDMVRVKQLVEKFGGLPYQPRKVGDEEMTAWRTAVPTPTPTA